MLKRPLSSLPALLVAASCLAASGAWANDLIQLPIAIKGQAQQAIDLLDQNGNEISRNQVATILKRDIDNKCPESGYLGAGCVDVSRFEPNPKLYNVWKPASLPLSNANEFGFPADGASLDFVDSDLESSGMVRARVKHAGRDFRLVFDMDSHQTLMTAALLRHLGYPVDSPRHYENLTLRFSSAGAIDDFLDDILINSSFFHDRWVVSIDKKKFEIVVRDVNIETPDGETADGKPRGSPDGAPAYYFGRIGNSWLTDRRATRALLVPLSLLDVRLSTRSVNLYPWEFSTIMAENILIEHPYATAFNNQATYEDLRWIARKIGFISKSKWADIVAEAHYPPCIEQMVLRKVYARRDDMLADFNLVPEFRARAKGGEAVDVEQGSRGDEKFSCKGEIVKGKVKQEYYDGHAERFTVGDPLSPLRWSELKYYVKQELISQAINIATSYLNRQFQFKTVQSAYNSHLNDVFEKQAKWALEHPGTPYTIPFSTWAKPIAGGNVAATRSLTTGTYYGSDSKAQLVDNVSIGVSLGFINGLMGNNKLFAKYSGTGGVALQRSITHVRAIDALSAVKKEKWSNMATPWLISKFAKLLNPVKDKKKISNADVTAALVDFLDCSGEKNDVCLGEGDVLTITDAYVGRLNPQYTISLTALMGALVPDPITGKLLPSIGIGATGEYAITKRVMMTRRDGRIEIYDNAMNTRALGGNLDLNVWMKIASAQYQQKRGKADTDAFYLDTSVVEDSDKKNNSDLNVERRRLLTALHNILVTNETDIAAKLFPPTHFKHKLRGETRIGKFLWWQWSHYDENHKMTVTPPQDPSYSAEPRTLYSSRRVSLSGKDMFSFVGQIISKLSNVPGLLASSGSSDPSATLFGKSNRSQVRAEAELTPGSAFEPMLILEDSYSGWFLAHDHLIKILDRIQNKVQEANMGLPIFHAAAFNNAKTVQNYEIRSNIMIYPKGVKKLFDHLNTSSRKDMVVRLVNLTDLDDLKNRCRDYLKGANVEQELAALEKLSENDETIKGKCIHPWMRKALRKMRKAPGESEKEDRVQWIAQTFDFLERHVSIARIMNFIGTENYFFQLQVSGFRTKDENGDTPYMSDSIGTVTRPITLGPFRDLRLYQDGEEWNVSSYETEARYFGNGL